jgi:phosphoglycolate phosphatase-like HAD superfamily hydrolase
VAVALVTGKGEASATLSLRHFGIAEAFDAVETGSPTGVVKAEAIARLLGRWGLAPDRAIYVGDAVADMAAAREAGVVPVGAAWADGVRAADLSAAGAHVVFTAPGDFVAWLASRLPGDDAPRA